MEQNSATIRFHSLPTPSFQYTLQQCHLGWCPRRFCPISCGLGDHWSLFYPKEQQHGERFRDWHTSQGYWFCGHEMSGIVQSSAEVHGKLTPILWSDSCLRNALLQRTGHVQLEIKIRIIVHYWLSRINFQWKLSLILLYAWVWVSTKSADWRRRAVHSLPSILIVFSCGNNKYNCLDSEEEFWIFLMWEVLMG